MILSSQDKKLRGKWKHLGSGVYESIYGDRVHSGGMILMSTGERISLNRFPCYCAIHDYMMIQGGSKRRGMMMFTELATKQDILSIAH